VLLDSYALEFAGLGSTLLLLEQEIEATEDYLKFRLDSARNKLIRYASCVEGRGVEEGRGLEGRVRDRERQGQRHEG
jgi:hypothetical protein